MTLSVGAAMVDPARQSSTADLMRSVGSAKQLAKSRAGNAMIVNDGEAERTMRLPALVAATGTA
jgi:hypothetical protein